MERFKVNAYPSKEEMSQLAKLFNVTESKIYQWFNRMRHKKVVEGKMNKSE